MKFLGATAAAALLLSACSGASTERSDEGEADAAERAAITDRWNQLAAPKSAAPAEFKELPLLDQPLRRATTPRALIKQIKAAEAAITDPNRTRADLDKAGALQYLAYRTLGENPQWDRRVLDAMPPRLRPVVRGNTRVRREFRSMFPADLSTELPAWRIVEPESPQALKRYYLETEAEFGVDWEYLAAINLVETGMGRIQGFSVAGARGPMQFIPSTWEQYGTGDIDDPRDAIRSAGRYLEARGFVSGRPQAIDRAVFAYNNDTRYVRGVRGIAEQIKARPRSYLGYHAWPIFYLSARGDILLPVGYESKQRIPVNRYLRENPLPNVR